MSDMQTGRQAVIEELKSQLQDSNDGILESLADARGLSLLEVVRCLPEAMWRCVDGGRFVEVMGELAEWGALNIIVHSADAIIEVQSEIPAGTIGHGFYNLKGGQPLSGHLKPDRIADIVFLQRPFMGRATASVQFFNPEGECAFKIYLGRDEQRELRKDQLERFEALATRLTGEAAGAVTC